MPAKNNTNPAKGAVLGRYTRSYDYETRFE